MGSLYLILIAIGTPSTIVGFAFGKTIVPYLVTSYRLNSFGYLDLWLFVQQHNELEVQNSELFVQTFHFPSLPNNKEVKQIYTLVPFLPFLIC
jgi:hypothetical protein